MFVRGFFFFLIHCRLSMQLSSKNIISWRATFRHRWISVSHSVRFSCIFYNKDWKYFLSELWKKQKEQAAKFLLLTLAFGLAKRNRSHKIRSNWPDRFSFAMCVTKCGAHWERGRDTLNETKWQWLRSSFGRRWRVKRQRHDNGDDFRGVSRKNRNSQNEWQTTNERYFLSRVVFQMIFFLFPSSYAMCLSFLLYYICFACFKLDTHKRKLV